MSIHVANPIFWKSKKKHAENRTIPTHPTKSHIFPAKSHQGQSICRFTVTEGKTDWKHLKAALKQLQESGEFSNLDIEFLEFENEIEMGDSQLLKIYESIKKISPARPVICLFDRDNPDIIKRFSGSSSQPYVNPTKNVFGMCLPVPSNRSDYKNISIEFFYTDEELKTPEAATGKRLVFSNEINIVRTISATHKNKSEESYEVLENPKDDEEFDKKIFCKDAEKIMDSKGNCIALSKAMFADLVFNKTPPFDSFSRIEFKKIFEQIEKALSEENTLL